MNDRCEFVVSTVQAYLNSESLEVQKNAIIILGLLFSKLKWDKSNTRFIRVVQLLALFLRESKNSDIRIKAAEALTNINLDY